MSQQMKRGNWSNLALHLCISTDAVPLQIGYRWPDGKIRCAAALRVRRTPHERRSRTPNARIRLIFDHFMFIGTTRARAGSPYPARQLLRSPRAGQLLFVQPPLRLTAQIAVPCATSEPAPGNPSSNRVISMFPIAVVLQYKQRKEQCHRRSPVEGVQFYWPRFVGSHVDVAGARTGARRSCPGD